MRAGDIVNLETRDRTIFALGQARRISRSRDRRTSAASAIARRALATYLMKQPKFHREVTAEFVRLIYLTSPLHDIGKVAIPDGVLLKPE